MAKSGLAKGINKGHVTTERARPVRPDAKKMVRCVEIGLDRIVAL